MLSGHTIWCVLMFTVIAVTNVVAKPSTDASPSEGDYGKSTNEGGNTSEGKEMSGEPSCDKDIDECLTSNNTICPDPHTECVNTVGSYICLCLEGYVQLDEELCQDLDECDTFDNLCLDPRTKCVNTEGSYTCGCKEGFVKLEGGFCHDIDECVTSKKSCPDPHTQCVNTEGSYICPCLEGYFTLEGTCQDVNECCTTDNTLCLDPRTECANTDGSYTCHCSEGYKLEGEFCQEIDECITENACPDPGTVCVNTEGSYTCPCRQGYFKLEGGACHEVDECLADNACPDPGSECVNTEGSYTCPCLEGYLKLEGGSCHAPYNLTCSQMPKDPPRVMIPLRGGPVVLCDTVTDGGGWIVFQRRTSGDVDFYRDWSQYRNGFGNLNGNFWLGNENIHEITSKRPYELRVDLIYKGKSYFAQYDTFSIESEQNNYTLRLGAFLSKSNAKDSLNYHNGMAFSTFDRDNDPYSINCAVSHHGAWWYRDCHYSNLNGHWGDKTNSEGPNWYHLTTHNDVVTFSEMKIRPIDQD